MTNVTSNRYLSHYAFFYSVFQSAVDLYFFLTIPNLNFPVELHNKISKRDQIATSFDTHNKNDKRNSFEIMHCCLRAQMGSCT